MDVVQESHTKRPSRIYAGCDVSTPIDPLVPVALLVPFAAVWKVRGFMLAAVLVEARLG